MKYYVLASGSSGNCTILDIDGKLLMIDVGIAVNEIEEKLFSLGYTSLDIGAILITHDHNDHIRSIRHYDTSLIYGGHINYNLNEGNILEPNMEYELLGCKIIPVMLSHDSGVCYGYRIEYNGEVFVYVTDTGYFSVKNLSLLENADYYVFESNHDPSMLMKTRRPMFIKQRILSDYGHLCNNDSAFVLTKLIGKKTKQIVLAHLSREANTKELAYDTFYAVCNKYSVDTSAIALKIADQFEIVGYDR